MFIETLFGTEEIPDRYKSLKFKVIRAVYETLTVKEAILEYLQPLTRYTAPNQIFEAFRYLNREAKEHFIAMHLDGKNRINCIDLISTGSLNQSIVHPREVFKTALLSSAASIILLHNHPTGDPTPSSEDIAITRRLVEGGELIGIKILDHIIIGETYLSFTERGLL